VFPEAPEVWNDVSDQADLCAQFSSSLAQVTCLLALK